MNAHILVGLAVYGQFRRHLDVRAVEVGEFLFPVSVLELEEVRAQRLGFIERRVREGFHICRRKLPARLWWFLVLVGTSESRAPRPAGATEIGPGQNCIQPLTDFLFIEKTAFV